MQIQTLFKIQDTNFKKIQMKKHINSLLFLLIGLAVISCDKNEIPTIDVRDARAIAGFNGVENQTVVFDPSQPTENIIRVGVSTLSDEDRAVEIEIDQANTTLDPAYYSISTLNPVIPAGEFTTEVVVTTTPGADLPASDAVLELDLVSVENSEILPGSTQDLQLGLDVQCPEVDLSVIPGTYQITADAFGTYLDDGVFEIVEGPGENQFTMINPFAHPNPNAGGEENFDIVFSIDPGTGAVTVAKQAAWHCVNFGCTYGEGRVEGIGTALTCINQIDFALKHTVDAGSFGTYGLTVNKI